ncbi:MAG: sodium-dependent transporter [Lachnospiraceae bacterium]|nr:sodium-dependent transporter [Lachnospiraceae bacterium]MBR3170283.1 sodium-dependent transporter [Lachnospiraceae bacterium]
MKTRENLGSRLGFILLSAGCAIGIGNVWRFPYITGQNGGGLFVLIYLACLVLLGIPVLTMEYSIGRFSRKSILPAFRELEPQGTKWHIMGYFAVAGNYVLLMFYSVVSGWILHYFTLMLTGHFEGATTDLIEETFGQMMSSPSILIRNMLIVMALTSIICGIGLQNGVERITKVMMLALIIIMVFLGIRSAMLPGGKEGLAFYLLPSVKNLSQAGIGNVIIAALNQSFFTLSIGMGGMEIFGSYIEKDRSLLGEAILVTALDTFVAIVSGLIIFPACFSYGIAPDAGPSLIFLTLPTVFLSMPGGRLFGTFFFVFLFFAALSTMIGVFENIMGISYDLHGVDRRKSALINGILIAVGSIPCALGFNVLSFIQPLREGNCIMDLEDFFVSNLVLPIGSMIITLFCTWKYGWGFDNYMKEVNTGTGLKVPAGLRFYFKYILPCIIGFVVMYGLVTYF